MSYEFDNRERNEMYAAEREESCDARRFAAPGGECYGPHRMRGDGGGGGSCTACGLTVSASEL